MLDRGSSSATYPMNINDPTPFTSQMSTATPSSQSYLDNHTIHKEDKEPNPQEDVWAHFCRGRSAIIKLKNELFSLARTFENTTRDSRDYVLYQANVIILGCHDTEYEYGLMRVKCDINLYTSRTLVRKPELERKDKLFRIAQELSVRSGGSLQVAVLIISKSSIIYECGPSDVNDILDRYQEEHPWPDSYDYCYIDSPSKVSWETKDDEAPSSGNQKARRPHDQGILSGLSTRTRTRTPRSTRNSVRDPDRSTRQARNTSTQTESPVDIS